jgi:hypothetical protein
MRFSFRHFFLASYLTERWLYGQKGLDIRSRLVVWRALKNKGLTEEESQDAMLSALPLNLGDRFSLAAALATLAGGSLFIFMASDSLRDLVLQVHRLFDGPLDYALLAVQWLLFYVILSLAGSCVACVAAVWVYASRTARYV